MYRTAPVRRHIPVLLGTILTCACSVAGSSVRLATSTLRLVQSWTGERVMMIDLQLTSLEFSGMVSRELRPLHVNLNGDTLVSLWSP